MHIELKCENVPQLKIDESNVFWSLITVMCVPLALSTAVNLTP